MKFTKEQAVEKLNQTLTNNGKKPLRMSARTLEAQAETLMALVGDEEMELDDFVTKVKPMLENVNSNMEKDQSDFIKEYKKNHPEKAPEDKQSTEPSTNDSTKALLDRIEALEAQARERDEAAAVDSKRKEIRKYLNDNNVKDAKWIDSVLSIATITKDDDAKEKGKTYLELYNQSRADSAPVTPQSTTSGGSAPNDPFAAVRALRKDTNGENK